MPRKINMELFNNVLNEKDKQIIGQVEKAVTEDVDKAIDEFRDGLLARARKYAEGDYDHVFEKQAEQVTQAMRDEFESTELQFEKMAKSAIALNVAIAHADAEGDKLKELSQKLLDEVGALEKKLTNYNMKLVKVGSTTGKFLVQGITRTLTGGVT